jgi:hypothetical protein
LSDDVDEDVVEVVEADEDEAAPTFLSACSGSEGLGVEEVEV